MSKIVAAGVAALFVAMSAPSFAQKASSDSMGRFSAADWQALTDTRINLVKAALQLTPDQEKYWPAIEKAIRTRAEHRKTRIENLAQAMAGEGGLAEAIRKQPVQAMEKRGENLIQRGTDLKNLADAWQPLYQTLKPDQKQRMAVLGISVLHAVGSAVERRRWLEQEDSED
jgi:hypothetical protein